VEQNEVGLSSGTGNSFEDKLRDRAKWSSGRDGLSFETGARAHVYCVFFVKWSIWLDWLSTTGDRSISKWPACVAVRDPQRLVCGGTVGGTFVRRPAWGFHIHLVCEGCKMINFWKISLNMLAAVLSLCAKCLQYLGRVSALRVR
jgi:hypothetical protein